MQEDRTSAPTTKDTVRWVLRTIILAWLLYGAGIAAFGQSPAQGQVSWDEIQKLMDSVRAASFPQLKDAKITLRPMRSDYVYLEGRFTILSFLFASQLRYLVLFNPEAASRQVPPDGLQAIMAHELAHIDYYHRRHRLVLAGLIRLVRAPFAVRFERGADLEAISLGYGPGLESYRTWLYRNIPRNRIEPKKRDYFSPEEIEAILRAVQDNPQIMGVFSACVPRSLAEIEQESRSGARCAR